jgi:hypothetical protein
MMHAAALEEQLGRMHKYSACRRMQKQQTRSPGAGDENSSSEAMKRLAST